MFTLIVSSTLVSQVVLSFTFSDNNFECTSHFTHIVFILSSVFWSLIFGEEYKLWSFSLSIFLPHPSQNKIYLRISCLMLYSLSSKHIEDLWFCSFLEYLHTNSGIISPNKSLSRPFISFPFHQSLKPTIWLYSRYGWGMSLNKTSNNLFSLPKDSFSAWEFFIVYLSLFK
jgi:hypothetical protein